MNETYEYGIPPQEFADVPQEADSTAPEFTPPESEFPLLQEKTEEGGKEFNTVPRATSDGKKSTDGRQSRWARNRLAGMLGSAAVATVVLTSTLLSSPGIAHEFRMEKEACILGDHTVYLNGNTSFEIGAIWSVEPIDLSEPTRIEFEYFMNDSPEEPSDHGCDGFAVAFAEGPYSGKPGSGGELGYEGIAGVEFDAFQNGEFVTDFGGDDYPGDHIAIIGNAVWRHQAVMQVPTIDDDRWHHVAISVEAGKLSVYWDHGYLMSADLPELAEPLYVGITGANGTGTAYKLISNITINRTPVVLSGPGLEKTAAQEITETLNRIGAPIPVGSNSAQVILTENQSFEKDDTAGGNRFEKIGDLQERGREPDTDPDAQSGGEPPGQGNSDVRTCRTCNGAGFICPGSVAADDPEGCHGRMYVSCKACNQTGREADGSPCNWCKGTLTHMCPSFEEHYTCPDCGGTGIEK